MPPGGPSPWGYGQPPQPPQPPRKNNTGLIIGLAVGVVVLLALVGVGVGLALSKSGSSGKPTSSPIAGGSGGSTPTDTSTATSAPPNPVDTTTVHTIALPSSVDSYTHSSGNVADRMVSAMRDNFTKDPATAAIFQNAKIGLYSSGAKQIIFVGLSTTDSPQLSTELHSHASSYEVDSVFSGAGIANANDYPTGPNGGTLRCGQGTSGGTPATMCSWADYSTFGMILQPNTQSAAGLAPTALDFRNAAEH
jgi:hypothetical protein